MQDIECTLVCVQRLDFGPEIVRYVTTTGIEARDVERDPALVSSADPGLSYINLPAPACAPLDREDGCLVHCDQNVLQSLVGRRVQRLLVEFQVN